MKVEARAVTDTTPCSTGQETGAAAREATQAVGAPRRRRVPSPKVTILAAVAGFLIVFELLAYQLRSGHDPAIGAGPLTAQVQHGSPAAGQPTSGSSGAVVTRASGTSTAVSQPTQVPVTARPAQPASHSIATRTSGGGQPGSPSTSGDDGFEQEGRL
jgi:hypothetical protein